MKQSRRLHLFMEQGSAATCLLWELFSLEKLLLLLRLRRDESSAFLAPLLRSWEAVGGGSPWPSVLPRWGMRFQG